MIPLLCVLYSIYIDKRFLFLGHRLHFGGILIVLFATKFDNILLYLLDILFYDFLRNVYFVKHCICYFPTIINFLGIYGDPIYKLFACITILSVICNFIPLLIFLMNRCYFILNIFFM